MFLVLVVYLISMLPQISSMFWFFGWGLAIAYPGFIFLKNAIDNFETEPADKTYIKYNKFLITLGIMCMIMHSLVPTQKTAYYMLGAYATSEIVTSDKAKILADKSFQVVTRTLDAWQKDSTGKSNKESVAEPVATPVKEPVKVEAQATETVKSDSEKAVEVVTETIDTANRINAIIKK